MNAPPKVKQKRGGFCFAACIMSLDNSWGGKWNQDSIGINQANGNVDNPGGSKVAWDTGTASLSGIKSCIDGGNYALVHTKKDTTHQHWVIAYSATSATEKGIMVMDPVVGNYITLYDSMEIEKYHIIVEVRKAKKR